MTVRTTNRVLAVLVALALVALAVLVPIEVVRALAGAQESLVLPYQPVADFLRDNPWSAAAVIAIGVAIGLLGLLLLVWELWPRRPDQLAVATDTEGVTAGISRRSLGNAVAGAATDTPGIADASASVKRRRVVVDVATALHDPGDLADQARQRADAVLDGLELERPRSAQVRLSHRKERT